MSVARALRSPFEYGEYWGGLVDGDDEFQPDCAIVRRYYAGCIALGLALLAEPTGRVGDFGIAEVGDAPVAVSIAQPTVEGGRRNTGKLKMLSLDSSQTSRQFVTIWFCERDPAIRHVVPFVSKGDVRLTVFSVSTAHARNRDAREPGLGVRHTRCLHEECNATQAPSRESHG